MVRIPRFFAKLQRFFARGPGAESEQDIEYSFTLLSTEPLLNGTSHSLTHIKMQSFSKSSTVSLTSSAFQPQSQTIISAVLLAERIPRGGEPVQPDFPAPVTEHRVFVSHPGAVQSSLRLGRLLFPRQHPDFVGMQVVATALGGYFGSRLMQNLRERNGYTYGVVAAMVNFEREGYFAVATQVGTDVTQAALQEIYREIERLRTEEMPAEELELVKNMMTGEMMRVLDGPFGIADVTIENILCGFDNSVIGENIHRIRNMTPADVQRLARKYLAREELVTVAVGAEDPMM